MPDMTLRARLVTFMPLSTWLMPPTKTRPHNSLLPEWTGGVLLTLSPL